ncbi:hypothetical protein [Bradyrhizobium sp. 195]
MRQSPSIVPLDRLDRDIYLVLEHFGARAGCAWRETDEQDSDRETVLHDLLSGQYAYLLRIVAFNPIEGWSGDATEDIADPKLPHKNDLISRRRLRHSSGATPALTARTTAARSRLSRCSAAASAPVAAPAAGAGRSARSARHPPLAGMNRPSEVRFFFTSRVRVSASTAARKPAVTNRPVQSARNEFWIIRRAQTWPGHRTMHETI